MFEAEAEGLEEIAAIDAVPTPAVIAVGIAGDAAVLVLEYLVLHPPDRRALRRFGEDLARLHAATRGRFGWHRDNTIGATPQGNRLDADWCRFFSHQRIGRQLEAAAFNGFGALRDGPGQRLLEVIPTLLAEHAPVPSLLHGDLWRGNMAMTGSGDPVVYDPAVYYGDREADIAMTELFGGFGREFRDAYEATWPLDPGYRVRRELYNLYHVLNHLNLFGGGYLAQAEGMMVRLLAECT